MTDSPPPQPSRPSTGVPSSTSACSYSTATVLGLIAADTGQTVDRVFEDSPNDHWYSATRTRTCTSPSTATGATRVPCSPSPTPCGSCPRCDHLCWAGNRCRSRPARRGHRRKAVGLAVRSGRAPPARSQGTGAIPEPILPADEVVRIRAEIEDVLTVHCGRSVDRPQADTDHDRVFTARQARQYGLVDHVITRR